MNLYCPKFCCQPLVLLVILFACSLCGCTSSYGKEFVIEGLDHVDNNKLQNALVTYYEAEKERKWDSTYSTRPVEFRKIIPFDSYAKAMEEGANGWKLRKIEILEVSKDPDGDYTIRIRFHEEFVEKAAQKFFGQDLGSIVNRRIENTVWRNIQGKWVTIVAGQRGHFPLNGRMVRD